MVAAYRARNTARDDRVCNDPWAAALAGEEGHAIARDYDKVFEHMEVWTAVRTAFFDDRVRRYTAPGGISQVVLLGAGFDSRAARLGREGVRYFEVDQPESQRVKLERIAGIEGYPVASATYVSCDFEREDFLAKLIGEGFRSDQRALYVWEGVTPYLTETAVRATLRRLAEGTHPGSIVMFDHVRKKMVAGALPPRDDASRAFVAELGEPLRFGIDYPLPLLYEEGFRCVRSLTFDELCLDYTGTYARERAFRFQGVVLATREAQELR